MKNTQRSLTKKFRSDVHRIASRFAHSAGSPAHPVKIRMRIRFDASDKAPFETWNRHRLRERPRQVQRACQM